LILWSYFPAPVVELPVLEVVSALHLIADLTPPLGGVVHDYLALAEVRKWPRLVSLRCGI
jgi:acetoacetate decarboxylase